MIKSITAITFISILTFAVVGIGLADIYSWVDDDGLTNLSDTRPGSDKKQAVTVKKQEKSTASDDGNRKTGAPNPARRIDEKPAGMAPANKLSDQERDKRDREIRATWNNMKNALQGAK